MVLQDGFWDVHNVSSRLRIGYMTSENGWLVCCMFVIVGGFQKTLGARCYFLAGTGLSQKIKVRHRCHQSVSSRTGAGGHVVW